MRPERYDVIQHRIQMNPVYGVMLVTLAAVCGGCLGAQACDSGTVRDAAIHAKRDMHRLCVVRRQNDSESDAAVTRLKQWMDQNSPGFNATVDVLAAEDAGVIWSDYGMPSAPPSLPVTVLVGRFAALRRTFVIDHWEPSPTEEDLAILRTSPARESLKKALTEYWAVILYSPAAQQPGDYQPLFEKLRVRWAKEQSPGITIVSFDRADPKERILRSFTGVTSESPDWAGIVFGRGKLLAPPMSGDEISEEEMNQRLTALAVPCTCLQESTTIGLDIPIVWEPEYDQKFEAWLNKAPGYTEITFEKQAEELAEEVPDASRQTMTGIIIVLALLIGTSIAAAGLILWRARRGRH